MGKKRVLFVTQEMDPYVVFTEMAKVARQLPAATQSGGMEIRILMPKFGTINERRHRLHEVVRLSGINIIIQDDDYPLIIKVASLPGARIQVYFLDNEDFFNRKTVFHDADGKFHTDNAERMIFFCKGTLETIKKFGWPPDIIHCHGWMTSLIPMYLKTEYADDPVFAESKVVYSVYENTYKGKLGKSFKEKAAISAAIKDSHLKEYKTASESDLNLGGIHYSDAIVVGDEKTDKKVSAFIKRQKKKPVFENSSGEIKDYIGFYNSLLQD